MKLSVIHFQLELEDVQELVDIDVEDDIVRAFVQYNPYPSANIDQSVRNNSITIVVVTMLNNHRYNNRMMPNDSKDPSPMHFHFE